MRASVARSSWSISVKWRRRRKRVSRSLRCPYLPRTSPVPSLYLPRTFPVPSLSGEPEPPLPALLAGDVTVTFLHYPEVRHGF